MYKNKVSGKVTSIFPRDINTDDIIPAPLLQETMRREDFALYAFKKYDPNFIERSEGGSNIIVAGTNFGCGSSREQAVYALKYNNVVFVVAQKDPTTGTAYPDIFYRNSVNNGFAVIAIDDISGINLNDMLELDLQGKTIYNQTKNKTYHFEMPEKNIQTLIEGGLLPKARADLEERLKKSI